MSENLQKYIGEDNAAATARRGPLAEDTGEITTEDRLEALREEREKMQEALDAPADYDDEAEEGEGGILELLKESWVYVLVAIAAAVLLVFLLSRIFGGGAEPESAATAGGASAERQEQGPRDTGVAIEEPTEDDGTYYLKAGDIAWKGELEETENGEELTLEGATAAQFKRAVTLPKDGSIMTGVFGRAEPDQPIVHATFQRTTIGEEERTHGTYQAIDGGRVVVQGDYEDEREGETVTRTYAERDFVTGEERTYAVTFKAPKAVPIPALIGWEPPAPVAEDAQPPKKNK